MKIEITKAPNLTTNGIVQTSGGDGTMAATQTPTLYTPASGTLTNCTGTAKNLTAGGNPITFQLSFGIM